MLKGRLIHQIGNNIELALAVLMMLGSMRLIGQAILFEATLDLFRPTCLLITLVIVERRKQGIPSSIDGLRGSI